MFGVQSIDVSREQQQLLDQHLNITEDISQQVDDYYRPWVDYKAMSGMLLAYLQPKFLWRCMLYIDFNQNRGRTMHFFEIYAWAQDAMEATCITIDAFWRLGEEYSYFQLNWFDRDIADITRTVPAHLQPEVHDDVGTIENKLSTLDSRKFMWTLCTDQGIYFNDSRVESIKVAIRQRRYVDVIFEGR